MLLTHATLATLEPPAVERADLRIEAGTIAERGAGLRPIPGEDVVDLAGKVVLPGFVNAHTHLYSALARGMPPPAESPRNFVEILERVWWKLDRALDREAIYLSGLVGAIDAALSGTTTLFDHHASPSFIRGSLATLRGAVAEVGLRSVHCYEVTDRNGADECREGLDENQAFCETARDQDLTRAMVGGHASFTLSEASLDGLKAVAERNHAPLHIHVAEDRADVEDSRRRSGTGIVERLGRHGLVGRGAILAHGVHLTPEELERAQALGAWLVHNPRSNMNNAVGYAPTASFRRAALGTDGMDEDMLAEARAAFLRMRDAGRPDVSAERTVNDERRGIHSRGVPDAFAERTVKDERRGIRSGGAPDASAERTVKDERRGIHSRGAPDAFGAALAMLSGGHRLAAETFALGLGRLDPGAPADLAVLDYDPPTPLHAGNLGGHLLFGVDRSHVASVLVAGRWVVRDRHVQGVDARAVFARAREAAQALWARMAVL